MNLPGPPFRFLMLVLVCMLLAACKGLGGAPGGLGAVGEVIASSGDPAARPPLLVRYDGDLLVAWAVGDAEVSMYWATDGIEDPKSYVFPPRKISGGKCIVRSRSAKFAWEGGINDPLPGIASTRFSNAEVVQWHLAFFDQPAP